MKKVIFLNTLTIIAGVCGSISTIIALVVLIVKPIRSKFVNWISKTSDKDNIHQKIDELTELVKKLNDTNEAQNLQIDKTNKALLSTIRKEIVDIYNTCIENEFITLYMKDTLHSLYDEYVRLGGNSFVHDLVEELNNLPVRNN